MDKLTKAMAACLTYYGENEHNPNRVIFGPPWYWTGRQLNTALDRGWLRVGPGGWHILSESGRAALAAGAGHEG